MDELCRYGANVARGRGWKRYERNKRRKQQRRRQNRNLHHLIPRSRGGGNHRSNILLIDVNVHRELHRVFGNRTLEETIRLLQRVKRAKDAQRESQPSASRPLYLVSKAGG